LSWRSLLILSGLGRAHGLAGLGRAHGLTAHRFPSTTIATAPRFLPAATPAARAGRAVRLQFAATANATRGQLDGDALQTPQRLSGLVAAFIQLGADINIILGRSVVSGSQAILSALPTAADRIADMVAQVVRALVRFLCLPLQLLGVIGLKLGSVVENMGHQASDVASSLVQQKRPPRAIIPFARRAASTPPRRPAATANVLEGQQLARTQMLERARASQKLPEPATAQSVQVNKNVGQATTSARAKQAPIRYTVGGARAEKQASRPAAAAPSPSPYTPLSSAFSTPPSSSPSSKSSSSKSSSSKSSSFLPPNRARTQPTTTAKDAAEDGELPKTVGGLPKTVGKAKPAAGAGDKAKWLWKDATKQTGSTD